MEETYLKTTEDKKENKHLFNRFGISLNTIFDVPELKSELHDKDEDYFLSAKWHNASHLRKGLKGRKDRKAFRKIINNSRDNDLFFINDHLFSGFKNPIDKNSNGLVSRRELRKFSRKNGLLKKLNREARAYNPYNSKEFSPQNPYDRARYALMKLNPTGASSGHFESETDQDD